MTAHLQGGFDDAPLGAAFAFRAAMTVMARPGQIEPLAFAAPPGPLSAAAGTLLLTLCDPDTPVFLGAGHDTSAVRDWIAFHTGAPLSTRQGARFAVGTWDDLLPLSDFPVGTPEYPDRSATLIIDGADLSPGGATLTGPGIRERAQLRLPDVAAFQANAAHFPLGLDFFLAQGARVAALPRSTRVAG